MIVEWNNEDALTLIREYQKHTLLWDSKDKWHFNKNKKTNAWTEIAKVCSAISTKEIDIKEARKKISSLLGSFRREKAKGKTTIGTGNEAKVVYKTNWFAFKSFSFLLDRDESRIYVNLEDTYSDNNESDETQDINIGSFYSTKPENLPLLNEQTDLATISHKPTKNNYCMKPKKTKPKRAKKRYHQEDLRIQQAFEFIQQPILAEDETMIYAKYLANKLKQFEGRTRVLVEHGINALIFEAEMGKYDCKPGRISSTSSLHVSSLSAPSLLDSHVTSPREVTATEDLSKLH